MLCSFGGNPWAKASDGFQYLPIYLCTTYLSVNIYIFISLSANLSMCLLILLQDIPKPCSSD